MNSNMGLTDFFVMEANDYLERLDAMVSAPAPPPADEFVRLARALKGSALMAKQQPISDAAGAVEQFARALHANSLAWDEGTKQLAIRSVDDLKILVRNVRSWSEEDDGKARALVEELDRVSGRAQASRPPAEAGLDAGTRSFIGREGAAVANALDQAAKALQQDPAAREPLERVLTVMQPLQ